MTAAGWPQRRVAGFDRDDAGDWFAILECGHTRHVRHRPPWERRPWVLSAAGRQARIGVRLGCRRCAEAGEREEDR